MSNNVVPKQPGRSPEALAQSPVVFVVDDDAAVLRSIERLLHRARVMCKMSVRSVAELTRVADLIGIEPEG